MLEDKLTSFSHLSPISQFVLIALTWDPVCFLPHYFSRAEGSSFMCLNFSLDWRVFFTPCAKQFTWMSLKQLKLHCSTCGKPNWNHLFLNVRSYMDQYETTDAPVSHATKNLRLVINLQTFKELTYVLLFWMEEVQDSREWPSIIIKNINNTVED